MTEYELAVRALDAELDRCYAALERVEDATNEGVAVPVQLVGNSVAEVRSAAQQLECTAAALEAAKKGAGK